MIRAVEVSARFTQIQLRKIALWPNLPSIRMQLRFPRAHINLDHPTYSVGGIQATPQPGTAGPGPRERYPNIDDLPGPTPYPLRLVPSFASQTSPTCSACLHTCGLLRLTMRLPPRRVPFRCIPRPGLWLAFTLPNTSMITPCATLSSASSFLMHYCTSK